MGKEKAGNKAGEWEERTSQKGQEGLSHREGKLVVFAQPLQTADLVCHTGKLCYALFPRDGGGTRKLVDSP